MIIYVKLYVMCDCRNFFHLPTILIKEGIRVVREGWTVIYNGVSCSEQENWIIMAKDIKLYNECRIWGVKFRGQALFI